MYIFFMEILDIKNNSHFDNILVFYRKMFYCIYPLNLDIIIFVHYLLHLKIGMHKILKITRIINKIPDRAAASLFNFFKHAFNST